MHGPLHLNHAHTPMCMHVVPTYIPPTKWVVGQTNHKDRIEGEMLDSPYNKHISSCSDPPRPLQQQAYWSTRPAGRPLSSLAHEWAISQSNVQCASSTRYLFITFSDSTTYISSSSSSCRALVAVSEWLAGRRRMMMMVNALLHMQLACLSPLKLRLSPILRPIGYNHVERQTCVCVCVCYVGTFFSLCNLPPTSCRDTKIRHK